MKVKIVHRIPRDVFLHCTLGGFAPATIAPRVCPTDRGKRLLELYRDGTSYKLMCEILEIGPGTLSAWIGYYRKRGAIGYRRAPTKSLTTADHSGMSPPSVEQRERLSGP